MRSQIKIDDGRRTMDDGNKHRLWLRDIFALLFLAAFALAVCWPVLQGKVPVASDTLALWVPWSQLPHEPVHNSVLADSSLQFLPWDVFERHAIADGEWPLWDPYSFSGSPFAANSQNQLYYPLTWLFWLLPLASAITVRAVLNLALAGWGMYFFCRVLGLSRVGSLLAGLAFCGSGMMQGSVEQPIVAAAYIWLPWTLATIDKALRTRSWRWTALAALLCGVELVSGQLQWAIYAYIMFAGWVCWRSVQLWRAMEASVGALLSSLGRGAFMMAWGAALAGVHLAPFLELLGQSSRAGIRISSNSDPISNLVSVLAPNFIGNPMEIEGFPPWSNILWYVGLPTLVLAVVAVGHWVVELLVRKYAASYKTLDSQASAPFWLAFALIAVLSAYGVGPFLYFRWLPGLNSTLPVRIGYLFIVSLSVLAGLGLDRLRFSDFGFRIGGRLVSARTSTLALGIVVVSAPIGWAAVAWQTGDSWQLSKHADILRQLQAGELLRALVLLSLTCALLVLLVWGGNTRGVPSIRVIASSALGAMIIVTALDLWSMASGYNSFVLPQNLTPSAPSIEWLRAQPGYWRMMSVDNPEPSFVPNSHLLFKLPTVAGYDSLHPRRYDEYWGVAQPDLQPGKQVGPYANVFVRPQVYTSTLASLLNVKYITAVGELSAPAGFTKVYSREISIYENEHVLPRAFLVANEDASFLPPGKTLERLGAPDFDPRRELLLDSGALAAFGESSTPKVQNPMSRSPGSVEITSYKHNSVELEANLARSGWLVLADNNYPGWSVTVDGKAAQIHTAYHILRAVQLESGRHTVVFRYQPSLFVPSLVLSVGALLLILVGLVLGGRK